MPYIVTINQMPMSPSEKADLAREFGLLRAELNDIRTKYLALCTKLDADGGVTDTNYAAGATTVLAASQFTAT